MSSIDATYTHGHPERVVQAHANRTVDDSARFVVPHLTGGLRLLDVGCGPGSITVGLAALVAPGAAVGLDASEEIVEVARSHAAAQGVDNVTFVTGDVYALPYPDEDFDVVYAHQVLQHLGDPVGALREMRRVVRPGGIVAVREVDFATMTYYPTDPVLDRWRSAYRAVHRANGGEPDAGRRLQSWVLEAGLVDPIPSATTWTYADPIRRPDWADLWAQRTITPPFSERTIELGVADDDELEAFSSAFQRWGDRPDGWFAMIHGEVVARRA